MPHPTVSVAICLFNSSRFIDETLESVFAQTFDDYEVVLVDDGSTDGCVEKIEHQYSDRQLTIIRQPHQGLSMARRASIAAAAGEFVAFLDHDDLWLPQKLERQVAAARADPSVALLFSDCVYIDERGELLSRLSDEYDLRDIDVTGSRGYVELLRRGCFVWQSSVMARTAALRSVDAFDPAYPYIADYDTWLRIARRYPVHYTHDVLAKWRVHATQFTNRCPEITLADHRALLGPLSRNASIPASIRVALGDRLLGQHRTSGKRLLQQRRFGLAIRAAAGMFSYPDRLRDFCLASLLKKPPLGRMAVRSYEMAVTSCQRLALLSRSLIRAPGKIRRWLTGQTSATGITHVWIDGSALGEAQTGYFNFVSELIRALQRSQACVVHLVSSRRGHETLRARLGADAAGIRFHNRLRQPARPRGRAPHPNTIEVILWQGRFRWETSHRVAVVQDLTTKIHPELHTAGNIADFDAFLQYIERHAQTVATVSEHSRKDIIERTSIFPGSVSVIPMPMHPCFASPHFDAAFVTAHGIAQPYVLCVGTIEPRKNLRRLVHAFEMLADDPAARHHLLVLAGPQGWDQEFPHFLEESRARRRIRSIGMVPQAHLPSLYHFASAVVYPSVYEGFGLPVLEAMSASGVVLASASSSLPEVLGDGITFDPLRAEDISAAILRALTMTSAESADYRRRCRARADAVLQRIVDMPLIPGLPALSNIALT